MLVRELANYIVSENVPLPFTVNECDYVKEGVYVRERARLCV